MRKLTDRQIAVLAALERRGGRARLPWFAYEEFPALAPSVVGKVLDALEARGLVYSQGDRGLKYCGKLEWCLGEEPAEVPLGEGVVSALAALIQDRLGREDVVM